jgi:bacteriocin-like protein
MNSKITRLNNEELETIQGGLGSTILGNTTPLDPQLQQLHDVSPKRGIRNI